MYRNVSFTLVVVLLGISQAQCEELVAKDTLEAVDKISNFVAEVLKDKTKFVYIERFTAPIGSDLGLSKAVGDALVKKGFTIKADAQVKIGGQLFRNPTAADKQLIGFKIKGSITDFETGNSTSFDVPVNSRNEGIPKTGGSGEYAVPPIPKDPETGEKPAPPKPGSAIVVGTGGAAPSKRSPYEVEILVKEGDKYVVRELKKDGDNFRVKLKKGEIFAVNVKNGSDYEAAVSVLLDGLSRFALSDDRKFANALDLVSSKGTRKIVGYYRDSKTSDQFLVGSYSKSPAAKLLPSAPDVGTITVTFAAAWKIGDPSVDQQTGVASAGIEQGPPIEDPTAEVKREVGKIRAVIKIFYDVE